ncbi:MAG: leucyl aminopeptidase [Alphaproteobacteria bacterium GM202ARS2]|nr:leucyl aminopeptidase [Alphaproteobacteria bacterium GM202ARS2]
MIKCQFAPPPHKPSPVACLVLPVFKGKTLSQGAQQWDADNNKALSTAIAATRFSGRTGECLITSTGSQPHFVFALGFDDKAHLSIESIHDAMKPLLARITPLGLTRIAIDLSDAAFSEELALACAEAMALLTYRFDTYKGKKADEPPPPPMQDVCFITPHADTATRFWQKHSGVMDGVFVTRNLVNEPPNQLYPKSFSERIKQLEKLGVEVTLHDQNALKKMGMHAMLGVAQGSAYPPYMAVMHWKGGAPTSSKPSTKPIAFIGKGVTFDTGGVSLKPAGGMWEMKSDMGGAGVVTGLMHALAARKTPAHVVGIVGLVENAISGTAQRPSDIVVAKSGTSIEVLNTDAEGRLVLADVLWYAQETYKPQCIIDLATLTGAMVIALGHEYAGFFSNNDALANQLYQSGQNTNEKVWRLPLHKAYDKMLDSKFADVQNITNQRSAGSITAAQFLQRFIKKDVPWAHLDIAGVTYHEKPLALTPYGATGFGVRLLDRLVRDHYES